MCWLLGVMSVWWWRLFTLRSQVIEYLLPCHPGARPGFSAPPRTPHLPPLLLFPPPPVPNHPLCEAQRCSASAQQHCLRHRAGSESFFLLLLLLFILLYFTQCQCTFLSSSHFMPTCLSSYLGFKSLVDFQKFSPNPLPVLNIVMHSRCQLVVQLRSPKPSVATILKLHGEIMSNNTEQSYFLTSYPFPPLKQVLIKKNQMKRGHNSAQ